MSNAISITAIITVFLLVSSLCVMDVNMKISKWLLVSALAPFAVMCLLIIIDILGLLK